MRRKVVTEIGFDSDVSSSNTMWTDVSADINSIVGGRGRSKELDTIEAGQCTFTLDNEGGKYTPGRSGLGAKMAVRRPIRSYTSLDDNLVHFECVNPSTYDLDKARFYVFNGALDTVTDGTLSALVWRHTPAASNTDQITFVGGNSDADQITVLSGQSINVAAQVKVSAGTCLVGVGVVHFPKSGGGVTNVLSSYVSSASTTWVNITNNYTAPSDGAVRMYVVTKRTDASSVGYFRNLKMSFPSTDATYGIQTQAAYSGLYPVFRGYIDSLDVDTDGFTSTATIKAVDWLGVASRPLDTYTREYMNAAYKAYVAGSVSGQAYYWPCVQASDDTQAVAEFGAQPLTVRYDPAFPPTTGTGFSNTKVVPSQDGSSGSFQVDDSNVAKGAVLSFVNGGVPNVTMGQTFGVAFWVLAPTLPSSGRVCLWSMANASSTRLVGLWLNTDGSLTAEWIGDGAISDISLTTTAKVAANTATYVAFKVNITGGTATNIQVSVNNGTYLSTPSSNVNRYTPSYSAFGGSYYGSKSTEYFHGSISHILYATESMWDNLSSDLWAATNGQLAPNENTLVGKVLDFAAFPLYRRFDSGLSTLLPPSWESGVDASGLLSDAAGDGSATFFMGPEGAAVLHARDRRYTASDRWTISEWSGDLKFSLDAQYILNDVTAQRSADGVSREVTDDSSIAAYGKRAQTIRRNVAAVSELTDAAGWIIHKYRESIPRIDGLSIDATALNATGDTDAALIGLAFGGTLSDKVRLNGLPSSAPADSLAYFIEGLNWNIQVDGSQTSYQVSFLVSDANRSAAFILEDLTFGLLDSDGAALTY